MALLKRDSCGLNANPDMYCARSVLVWFWRMMPLATLVVVFGDEGDFLLMGSVVFIFPEMGSSQRPWSVRWPSMIIVLFFIIWTL